MECAKSHRTPGHPLGKLYLAVQPAMYALYTQQAYPQRAGNPGDTPFYAVNSTAAVRKQADNTFGLLFCLHHDENTMDQALIERFYASIDMEYEMDMREAVVAIPNATFLQVFDQAIRKYGRTTPTSQKKNFDSMTAQWHPSDGVQRLWRQIQDAANYAVFAGQAIPENHLVDAALICIARTQAYKQAYLDWRQEQNQTFAYLKTFFEAREDDREEVKQEAGSLGYGMSAMDPLDDGDATQQFKQTLTDFAASMAGQESQYTEAANVASQQQVQMAAALQSLNNGMQ